MEKMYTIEQMRKSYDEGFALGKDMIPDEKTNDAEFIEFIERLQKQSEQQSNCNLPHVSNNEVAVCDHKIIKKGFHKGRCACGLFKEKQ